MKAKKKTRWTTEKYDKEALKYDSKLKFILPDKFRKRVAFYLENGSVLDIACGTGSLLKYANQKGLNCYGIDLSKGMIEQAILKNPGVNLKVASYYDIPYENNKFDYVVSTYALGGIYIKVKKQDDKEIIEDISFQTFGCAAAIATSSMITELAKGKTLDEAYNISRSDVADALDGLPPIKLHCSNLATDALKDAITKYRNKIDRS